MDIPVKITPCPITEALIELRFETDYPADAIFGIVYKALKEHFPHVVKLPILQVPEVIRTKDPNFLFKPYYQIKNNSFLFQIGPNVFTLNAIGEYVGWEVFSAKMRELFKIISDLEIVNKGIRLALRYINFFNFNIYDKIDLKMVLRDDPLLNKQLNLRAEIEVRNVLHVLQVANNVDIKVNDETRTGSIIDIDTIINKEADNFLQSIPELLEEAHNEEKILFFSLLKEEYLQSLNPEYQA